MSEQPIYWCKDCGGDCWPECGLHPAGCIFGGFTGETAYWLVADGCPYPHEDEEIGRDARSLEPTDIPPAPPYKDTYVS